MNDEHVLEASGKVMQIATKVLSSLMSKGRVGLCILVIQAENLIESDWIWKLLVSFFKIISRVVKY